MLFKFLIIFTVYNYNSATIFCQEEYKGNFRILKVDSTSYNYLIKAVKSDSADSTLIIVPKPNSISFCKCTQKLEIGKTYLLLTETYLNRAFISILPVSANGFVLKIDSKILLINESNIPLKASNLCGCYYCPCFF